MSDYYRGDQKTGVSAPDLSKNVGFADHIVKARGKKTQYTSVSSDPEKITIFGESLYHLRRDQIAANEHVLVEHDQLISALQEEARNSDKGTRLKAVLAQRYARMRREGLVVWKCDVSRVDKKDLITWMYRYIQVYFERR